MKITINGKEHNWYTADLSNYTPEFLQEIILSLVDSPQTKPLTSSLEDEKQGSLDSVKVLKDKPGDIHSGIGESLNRDYSNEFDPPGSEEFGGRR